MANSKVPDNLFEPSADEGTLSDSSPHPWRVLGYAILLLLLFAIGNSGVSGVPLQFILKNSLKLSPQWMSVFGMLTDIPAYLGFAFGFLRDRWRPFGRGDRGYFLFLPLLMAGTELLLSLGPFTYLRVLAVMMLFATFAIWLGAAVNGLLTAIGQYNGMAGRLAVVLLVVPRLVGIASNAIGGHLSDKSHQHMAFLISAALCLPMLLLGFFKPRSAFAHEAAVTRTVPENVLQALRRLARHRAIYLPAIIVFLWAFAPGWGTPLFFYLTNTVKLSEAAYGNSMALIGVGTLVSALGYSLLCTRLALRPLLYWGTLLGVIGCPLFLLIHNQAQAYGIAFLAGVSLSVALCSFNDLLIRCCPPELEGAAFLFVGAASAIAADTSDLFGSWLFEKGGFTLALTVSTIFTALIFVVLPFVPRAITAPREGERLTEAIVPATATP